MNIMYKNDIRISVDKFIQILKESTLAERRPIDNKDCISKMIENADILITAWDQSKLVGVARSISDYSFCTYLSDLAVHVDYQKKGIGKELIKKTREKLDSTSKLILLSAPAAKDYYNHIGFSKTERAWILLSEDKF